MKRPTVLAAVAGCFKSGADCLAPLAKVLSHRKCFLLSCAEGS